MSFQHSLTRAENYISGEVQVPLDEPVLAELREHLDVHPKIQKAIRDAVSAVLARGNLAVGSALMADIWCEVFAIISVMSIGLTGIAISRLRRQQRQLQLTEESISWQLGKADRELAKQAAGNLSLRCALGEADIHYADFDS